VANDAKDRASNRLSSGLSLEQLAAAVEKSGYPLQHLVQSALPDGFSVQPEWGFRDQITGEMRAMDILATYSLYDVEQANAKRVRPELALLIECKRSEMPFIFFATKGRKFAAGGFPLVAGLKADMIKIRTDDDRSSWWEDIVRALSLSDHRFTVRDSHCTNISKAARKGADVVLSGQEAYQGLVLPIRSAVEYFRTSHCPRPTFYYFSAYLVIGLAILDAPMVEVSQTPSGRTVPAITPWQRLLRHEPVSDDLGREIGKVYGIDVIHRSFLGEYIEDHLLPFARSFGEAALRHDEELASGKGFVSGMGADPFSRLETRLRPRTVPLSMPEDSGESLPRVLSTLARNAAQKAAQTVLLGRKQRRRRGAS